MSTTDMLMEGIPEETKIAFYTLRSLYPFPEAFDYWLLARLEEAISSLPVDDSEYTDDPEDLTSKLKGVRIKLGKKIIQL